MRKMLIIPLLIFIEYAHPQTILDKLKTDSIKLIVDYNFYNGYINDSIYAKRMPVKLFIGKTISLTDIQLITAAEDSANISSQLSAQGVNESIKKMILERNRNGIHTITIQDYQSPGYYLYVTKNDKKILVEDTADFKWLLTAETKKIDSFNSQKAIGHLGNDVVTAWFTEQIPVNTGPHKINGLPGLILEYYNPSTKTCYKTVRIMKANVQQFEDFSHSIIIDQTQYNQMIIDDAKKIEKIKKMMQDGKQETSQL